MNKKPKGAETITILGKKIVIGPNTVPSRGKTAPMKEIAKQARKISKFARESEKGIEKIKQGESWKGVYFYNSEILLWDVVAKLNEIIEAVNTLKEHDK
jgi:hypothetical protein